MPLPPPTIVVLGAPGTGVRALCAALQAHLAPAGVRLQWGHAPDRLRGCTAGPAQVPQLTLLMGLDLPCPTHRRPAQALADTRLREQLDRAGITYRVVYGQGEQRVIPALNAIQKIAACADMTIASGIFEQKPDATTSPRTARLRAWYCEKCSDPECEHRLFTALTGGGTRGA